MLNTNGFIDESGGDEILSQRIMDLARECHESDFPNTEGSGCPDNSVLAARARSAAMPDEPLLIHLLSCSPCFTDFRNIRSSSADERCEPLYDPQPAEASAGRKWLTLFAQPVFAAVCIVIVGSVSVLLFQSYVSTDGIELAMNEAQPAASFPQTARKIAPKEPVFDIEETVPPAAASTAPREKTEPKPIRMRNVAVPAPRTAAVRPDTISINLDQAVVTRGESSRPDGQLKLPARNAKLNVTLRKNSPAGDYDISVLDEFGGTLMKKTARSATGESLRLNLDPGKKSGPARLCIAHAGDVPDCLAIEIVKVR